MPSMTYASSLPRNDESAIDVTDAVRRHVENVAEKEV